MDDLETPNCPICLLPMEAAERGEVIVWECSDCGLVKL
ncbi:zf-TFIIB domain-containing protein [Cryobacterium sp.]